ncbi:hypothetical protein KCP69_05700 [Salmonella enterica subsp. enterica]|nr:hypothetical protein KCP69_05700 [Salmonella enterica subsp. enterica]
MNHLSGASNSGTGGLEALRPLALSPAAFVPRATQPSAGKTPNTGAGLFRHRLKTFSGIVGKSLPEMKPSFGAKHFSGTLAWCCVKTASI